MGGRTLTGLPFDPERWREELRAWAYRLGGIPEVLLVSHDRSESYEADRAHVFKVRPGRYALVLEQGCSCYNYKDARIYLYGDRKSVMNDYNRWLESPRYKFGNPVYEFEPSGIEAKE